LFWLRGGFGFLWGFGLRGGFGLFGGFLGFGLFGGFLGVGFFGRFLGAGLFRGGAVLRKLRPFRRLGACGFLAGFRGVRVF
jgi:hypothetical protein